MSTRHITLTALILSLNSCRYFFLLLVSFMCHGLLRLCLTVIHLNEKYTSTLFVSFASPAPRWEAVPVQLAELSYSNLQEQPRVNLCLYSQSESLFYCSPQSYPHRTNIGYHSWSNEGYFLLTYRSLFLFICLFICIITKFVTYLSHT